MIEYAKFWHNHYVITKFMGPKPHLNQIIDQVVDVNLKRPNKQNLLKNGLMLKMNGPLPTKKVFMFTSHEGD